MGGRHRRVGRPEPSHLEFPPPTTVVIVPLGRVTCIHETPTGSNSGFPSFTTKPHRQPVGDGTAAPHPEADRLMATRFSKLQWGDGFPLTDEGDGVIRVDGGGGVGPAGPKGPEGPEGPPGPEGPEGPWRPRRPGRPEGARMGRPAPTALTVSAFPPAAPTARCSPRPPAPTTRHAWQTPTGGGGGGDPAPDSAVWMPLTTTIAGDDRARLRRRPQPDPNHRPGQEARWHPLRRPPV